MFLTKGKEKTRSGITKKQAKDLGRLAKKLKTKESIRRINKEH
ncbi:hypothetical protein [Gracilibacillus sp. YIM 98692]|nr:hypothetical protein [Gracilibacillus sp. YIM 98692]